MKILHPLRLFQVAFLSLLTLATTSSINAQNSPPVPPAQPDEEALHVELRGLKKIYEDAINSGDLKALAPVFGPQTSGVVATNEEFHSLDEMQQIFDRFKNNLGPGYVYRVTLNPERSLIHGDIAICRGTSDEYIKTGAGKEFQLRTRWTAVVQREGGAWHLLRSQVSMDPFHNSVTDSFFAAARNSYGGGGLAIGLLAGVGIGYFLGRRRKS